MTLTLTEYDAYLFRMYITELEFTSVKYDLTTQQLSLWKNKGTLWEQTAANYNNQLDLADFTLERQIMLQEKKDEQFKLDLKTSHRKGIKKGAAIAAITTIILCLLVR